MSTTVVLPAIVKEPPTELGAHLLFPLSQTNACPSDGDALCTLLNADILAAAILASALAFVKYKLDEPSVISSVLSFVATCAST